MDYKTYNITDPVYVNMLRWRIDKIREWQQKYFPNATEIMDIGTGSWPFPLELENKENINLVAIEPDPTMVGDTIKNSTGKFKSEVFENKFWITELAANMQPLRTWL